LKKKEENTKHNPTETEIPKILNRRTALLKFAGVSTAFAAAAEFLAPNKALAANWTKILSASGPANTWRKLNPVINNIGMSSVACGYFHSIALRSDGLVFGCGEGWAGQLGDNTSTSRRTYIQATGFSNAVAVAGGGSGYSIALRSDGLVFASGRNSYGQLGDNTTTNRSTYIQATGISNAVAVAGGVDHSIALRSDGLVFACGRNGDGRLGDNSSTSRSAYVQATGISNAVAVAAGFRHSIALRSDGLVFACGYNLFFGGLGDNSTTNRSTYVQATGISNAVAVAGGDWYSIALRSDGLVFGCGDGGSGQLGDNSNTSKLTYIQAMGISNAVAVACGQRHSIAL